MGESAWLDEDAVAEMAVLQEVITAIRTVRSEWGVAPAKKLVAFVEGADAATRATLEGSRDHLTRLAGLERFEFQERVARDPETVVRVVRGLQVHLPLAGIVDRQAELQRIEKELAKVSKQQAADEAKLGNPKFRERAAPEIVAETEARLRGVTEQRQKLETLLQELSR
jgi:valyl-tRNA synthetase